MGRGRSIECKCKEKLLYFGIGMGYPRTYKEMFSDIKAGKYGAEMKRLANETELVTVDASYKVYYCDNCSHIESASCLDLYKPNDLESAKKTVIGRWTVGESKLYKTVEDYGEWPYWWPNNRNKKEGDYVMLKRYEHNCPICKNEMTVIGEDMIKDMIKNMKCPKCGEHYEDHGEIMWD